MADAENPGKFQPLEIEDLRGSLADRVYQSLRHAILTMAYPPGTMLRKSTICDQLGVSRSPVSEAIARLSQEGLVDVIPQSGTKVSRFSMSEIREAAFLRKALELAAVAKVAGDHDADQIAQLTRNLRLQSLLVEDGDMAGFFQTDEEFHALLLAFTGFPKVASVVENLSQQLRRARMLLLPSVGRPQEALREHQEILKAVAAGNPDGAQDAMSYHLDQLIPQIAPLESTHPDYFRSH